MLTNVTIKNNRNGYQIIITGLKFKSKFNSLHKIYDTKLENSISRAKNVVFDLVRNNDFKFFVTLTLNSSHDRFDLSKFRKNINDRIKYMKKKGFTNLFYLLIPEKHKNGAIHFHGFFSAGFGEDMYYNDNGFLSLSSFDSLGFTSISMINNYEACTKYILKYINKDMCKAFKGQHLYFCSRGLKRSSIACQFISNDIQPINYDYRNEFVLKKDLDYYNLITYIDNLYRYNKIYYVISDNERLFD